METPVCYFCYFEGCNGSCPPALDFGYNTMQQFKHGVSNVNQTFTSDLAGWDYNSQSFDTSYGHQQDALPVLGGNDLHFNFAAGESAFPWGDFPLDNSTPMQYPWHGQNAIQPPINGGYQQREVSPDLFQAFDNEEPAVTEAMTADHIALLEDFLDAAPPQAAQQQTINAAPQQAAQQQIVNAAPQQAVQQQTDRVTAPKPDLAAVRRTGGKYGCPYCAHEGYTSRQSANEHIVHNHERHLHVPFTCAYPGCPERFTNIANFRRHKKAHSRADDHFKCKHHGCEYKGKRRDNLIRHGKSTGHQIE